MIGAAVLYGRIGPKQYPRDTYESRINQPFFFLANAEFFSLL
jgi:hypothetical protein